MNTNQLPKHNHILNTFFIAILLLSTVFGHAFAQDKPNKDTVKHDDTIHIVDHKSLTGNVLIVLDGKVVNIAKVRALNIADIDSVDVIKGKMAIAMYGKKGKNGVVVVTSNLRSGKQDTILESRIMSMLKSFYTSYITENFKIPVDLKKIDSIERKYCTASLLRKIKRLKLDYDVFLDAQDVNTTMLKTLDIRKDSKRNDIYIVSHLDVFNNKTKSIELMIVREKENYKIDSLLRSVWL